ncbi:glycosyltransferase, group 1 family [Legionella sainthelensi]|uniref:Glycosyltransferase, group 1 family n=1 Tax=Legionella sainthelensi TaxID=28087 RepID=A0A0W0YP43_9GAMM|nr:glycosyltransferase family 4 protein [Legionella sainthelensi]KTD58310.1 glycosyltransferase, group 1 family [Legionella sainthelensi]VEH27141.1 glycosyltransferase, group 1 family [Legionella sainthelensi]
MKILVVSQYFWPETFIINELVQCLAAQGHQIEVVTGKPNYPEGNIFEGYNASGQSTELFHDIPIHRAPLSPRGKGGKKLMLNYLSFIVNGLYHFPRFIRGKEFDVVFVFVPSPITSVIPAIYLKWRLKAHLAVWVQDLWPESVQATGFIQNSFLLKIIGYVVKGIYAASDTLLVQSKTFPTLMKKYTSLEKVVYYPNSFLEPEASITHQDLPPYLLSELESYTCFVFAGNLGTAQALETIINAAEKISHLTQCKILLIGSGSMSDWLFLQITQRKIKNVLIPGRFPAAAMPIIFSKAAALLVSLKKDELFSYTIPSKIQAYLAAGRPILAALDGEGARIVTEAQAGLVSPAEDADALAKNMEKLYHMPVSEREKLGGAARDFFLEHFEMTTQSRRLIEILNNKIKKEVN